jgi:hypothetical protein
MPDGYKMDLMALKYTNIFHRKTVQNLPKLVFWVWKQTIWQPRCGAVLFSANIGVQRQKIVQLDFLKSAITSVHVGLGS